MLIELRKGITIDPCTFTAIIGPAQVAKDLINTNSDLQRYLFLYVSGNYSRILTHVSRTSTNFEVRRAFTAHQFFTILNEVSHTVVFIEHDPTLFDGAWEMIAPIAGALGQISRESTVILYSPVADRSFSLLTRNARHVICFLRKDDPAKAGAGSVLKKTVRREAQMTLDAVMHT
jgi:DNA polymerase I